jgi:hypothetical protein
VTLLPNRHSEAQVPLKGGFVTTDPRLDRLPEFDDRSRNFSVALDPRFREKLKAKTWPMPIRLDQGSEGACVGFSRAHDLACSPSPVKGMTNDYAKQIYKIAQTLDEWPGENYSGSSVLGGVKAAQQLGYVGEYRWAFGIDDVLHALATVGPVVFGIPWLDSMFNTRPDGLLDCSGDVAGGHAIQGRSVHLPTIGGVVNISRTWKGRTRRLRIKSSVPVVGLTNSWDYDWGVFGEAFIKADDLENLLNDWGEACITTQAFR